MVRVIGVIVLRPPSPRSTSDGEVFARKNYLKNANSTVTSRNLERNSRALLPDEQVFGLFHCSDFLTVDFEHNVSDFEPP
jgi:hypothetical protein